MRSLAIRSLFLVLATLALLGGCAAAPPGEVYPLALVDTRSRVFATEVPTFVFGGAGAASVDVQAIAEPDKIIWPVTTKGQELFRYVATITPVDATHTRVAVALLPAASGAAGAKVARGLKENADIARLYRDAMTEAVDAKLENRDFTMAAITPQLTLAALGHLGDITAGFDRESARHGKQVKSNLERAYAAEGIDY